MIDRVTASRLGITPAMIDETLYDAFGQRQISTLYTQLNQYHVILETMPEFQKNPDELQRYLRALGISAASALTSVADCSTIVTSSTAGAGSSNPAPVAAKSRRSSGSANPAPVSALNGAAVPLSAFTHFESTNRAAVRQSSGTISGRHDFVQPGAQRVAGRRHRRDRQGASRRSACR